MKSILCLKRTPPFFKNWHKQVTLSIKLRLLTIQLYFPLTENFLKKENNKQELRIRTKAKIIFLDLRSYFTALWSYSCVVQQFYWWGWAPPCHHTYVAAHTYGFHYRAEAEGPLSCLALRIMDRYPSC